ncbi:hypothetical protein C0J52_04695, partial [Blattella germanica]
KIIYYSFLKLKASRQQRYIIHFYDFRVTYAVTFYIKESVILRSVRPLSSLESNEK